MKSSAFSLLFLLLAIAMPTREGHADAIDETIVFIECAFDGKVSRGTGVVVSARGHVLTARHVAPAGADCKGSLRVADSNLAAKLVVQPTNLAVDAALLRFSLQQDYAFSRFCPLEDWMVRKRIFVAGFPGQTQTGAPSYREGILSTLIPNSSGILETDGQTVAGMSGGPVYSPNFAGIVGIVIGAEFDSLGTVSYYGILPASDFAQAFGLTQAESPCYHQMREVDFFDPEENKWRATWTAGDGPIELGIYSDQAVCFLTGIFGIFNDPDDRVWVENLDGQYVMNGRNRSGEVHGGEASCVWYD
jgi:Trypsin-like peptidase domain